MLGVFDVLSPVSWLQYPFISIVHRKGQVAIKTIPLDRMQLCRGDCVISGIAREKEFLLKK